MGLFIGVGDYGIGDLVQKSEDLYNLLLDLCQDQLDWQYILNKPTTLAGFNITDAYTQAQVNNLLLGYAAKTHSHKFDDITDKPTTVEGYGIENAYNKDETDDLLEGKADVEHTHTIEDIEGLEDILDMIGWEMHEELPSPTKPKALYFIKSASDTRFQMYITDPAGVPVEFNAVTYSFLATALTTKQNKLTGPTTHYVRGDGTTAPFNKAAIDLDKVENYSPAEMPISDAQAAINVTKANDNEVLKKTGNQIKTSGILTFLISPEVPTATQPQQAINLGQTQDLIQTLAGEIFPQDEIPFEDPAEEWIWMHNMNKKPSVDVIVDGQVVSARREHLDNDTLKITFSRPQTGSIIVR